MSIGPNEFIDLPDAPDIVGLSYRHFHGEADYPAIAAIHNSLSAAGFREGYFQPEDLANEFKFVPHCNPHTDMLFADINTQMIAYGVCRWEREKQRKIFIIAINIRPEMKGKGIEEAMLPWLEWRAMEISNSLPGDEEHIFMQSCFQNDTTYCHLLEAAGYTHKRSFFSMVRPLEEDLPVPGKLPAGIEVRPALPSEYHLVWEKANEAFREHWGFTEPTENEFLSWQSGRWFQPLLWQVAWKGDQPVGQVQNFVDMLDNEKNSRLRGYTEGISVLKPYRRQGIASSLIARSLHMLKSLNLKEAALTVDSENELGALRLYENLGYRTYQVEKVYHKPMPK